MFIALIILTLVFAFVLPVYIVYENKHGAGSAFVLKLTLSGIFTAIAAMAVTAYSGLFFVIILIAACCSFMGDYFLQFGAFDNSKFSTGVLAFTLAQALLVSAFIIIAGFSPYTLLIFAVLVGFGILFMCLQRWDFKINKRRLYIYFIIISMMAANAVVILFTLPGKEFIMIGMGGILFYISDIILGIYLYQKFSIAMVTLNRITYFTGQFLIATGALFLAI